MNDDKSELKIHFGSAWRRDEISIIDAETAVRIPFEWSGYDTVTVPTAMLDRASVHFTPIPRSQRRE